MERISVIVPVYNAGAYLERCLDSLLLQTYTNLEIILIDDGSTDQSASICERYRRKDARIRVYRQPNAGVSAARNRGLHYAQGGFVLFVDADDQLHPQCAERLLSAAKESRYAITVCQIKMIYNGMNQAGCEVEAGAAEEISLEAYDYRAAYARKSVLGALFKSELVKSLSFDPALAMGEDTLFFAQALKDSGGICCIGEPLYYYLRHAQSSTHRNSSAKQDTEFQAWDRVLELFSTESARFRQQLHLAYAYACMGAFLRRCISQDCYNEFTEAARKRMMQELRYIAFEKSRREKLGYKLCCRMPRLARKLYRIRKLKGNEGLTYERA